MWDIPGGFLEPGEHPEDGAAREALEETGLTVRVGRLIGVWMDVYGPEATDHTLNFYYCAIPTEGGVSEPVAADDAVEIGWFGPNALPREIAFNHGRDVLEAWARQRMYAAEQG